MLGASIRFSVGSQNWKPLAFRRSKVIRWRQHAARKEGEVQVRVNLRKPLPTLLAEAWEWYPAHMLKRRVDLARSKQLDLSAVVMDGNAKLSGRICGRPAAEIIDNRSLDMFTVTCCSAEPQFKKRRCMKHDTSHAPADPLPEQSEVITAHRRVRRAGQGELYDVFLKVKLAVSSASASRVRPKASSMFGKSGTHDTLWKSAGSSIDSASGAWGEIGLPKRKRILSIAATSWLPVSPFLTWRALVQRQPFTQALHCHQTMKLIPLHTKQKKLPHTKEEKLPLTGHPSFTKPRKGPE